jgi:hypothetical protein
VPSPLRKPRLLVVTFHAWPAIEPFLRAFERAGFAVALVQGRAGMQGRYDASIAVFPGRPNQIGPTIERAVADLSPELVLASDLASFRHLAALRGEETRPRTSAARTLARAFGDVGNYAGVAGAEAIRDFGATHDLPVPHWPEHERMLRANGRPASVAIACRAGEILASLAVDPTAPTRTIRNQALLDIAERAVVPLRLSGLIGLDFVLEPETRQPWLLGINPFVEPSLPLAVPGEIGLADALYEACGSEVAVP